MHHLEITNASISFFSICDCVCVYQEIFFLTEFSFWLTPSCRSPRVRLAFSFCTLKVDPHTVSCCLTCDEHTSGLSQLCQLHRQVSCRLFAKRVLSDDVTATSEPLDVRPVAVSPSAHLACLRIASNPRWGALGSENRGLPWRGAFLTPPLGAYY